MSKVKTCDARCHNAKHEKCNCWCGGRFHGKGNEGALNLFVADIINNVQKLPEGVSLSLPDNESILSCINDVDYVHHSKQLEPSLF